MIYNILDWLVIIWILIGLILAAWSLTFFSDFRKQEELNKNEVKLYVYSVLGYLALTVLSHLLPIIF